MSLKKSKKSKNLSWYKDRAWKSRSKKIRLKHADHAGNVECYTCGVVKHWKEIQAGHAIDGRHGAVLFDEEIIRPQCVACNVMKHGNHPVFTTKLIEENGFEWWQEKLANSHQVRKWTREELTEMHEADNLEIELLECMADALG